MQSQVQELDEKIERERKQGVAVAEYDFGKIRANIDAKEQEVQALEAELQRQRQLT